jgi:hypothetical protein
MLVEAKQTKVCQHCKNTGIKWQDEEFNLSASTWCSCPVGEEKQRLVSETIRQSVTKGRWFSPLAVFKRESVGLKAQGT